MLQVFLDWENIYKTILEKLFIFIFCDFFLIWGLVSQNFEKGLFED
jgi:hypothetical protein